MMKSKVFSDVLDSTAGAKAYFDSYWALASEATGDLKAVMRKHPEYFATTMNAQHTAFFVYFAHLYDTRKDSSSIQKYLEELRCERGDVYIAPLAAEFDALKDRAKPLLTARHKTVAHIDALKTEKDVFLSIDITWKEVRQILAETVVFVLKLHGASSPGDVGIVRDGRMREATFKVLHALREKSA
jgi:hypothetical protein